MMSLAESILIAGVALVVFGPKQLARAWPQWMRGVQILSRYMGQKKYAFNQLLKELALAQRAQQAEVADQAYQDSSGCDG